jgi:hypothetical protein
MSYRHDSVGKTEPTVFSLYGAFGLQRLQNFFHRKLELSLEVIKRETGSPGSTE